MAGIYDEDNDKSGSLDPGEKRFESGLDPAATPDPSSSVPSKDDLKGAEESATDQGAEGTDQGTGKSTPGGDDAKDNPAAGVGDSENQADGGAPAPGKKQNRLNRAKSYWKGKKHKARRRLLAIGAAIIAPLIPLLIFLAFILLALGVPHYVENVSAWQFARMTRLNTASTENVMSEEIGIKSAPDTVLQKLRTRYANMRDSTFRNLERVSPSIVVRNLAAAGKLKTPEVPRTGALGKLGLQQIKGITINDRTVLLPKNMYNFTNLSNLVDKYIHPIKNFKAKNALFGAVDDALQTYNPNLNRIVRNRAALKILTDQLGVDGFRGIAMLNFLGKSKVDAAAEMEKEAYAVAKPKVSVPDSAPQQVKDAAAAAKDQTDKCLADPVCVKNMTGSADGLAGPAQTAVDKAFIDTAMGSFIKGTVGVINPLYSIAVPVCLVYSGSIFNPDESNSQSASVQNLAIQAQAVSAQQKRGDISSITSNNGQIDTTNPTPTDKVYNVNAAGLGTYKEKLDGPQGNGMIDSNALLRENGQFVNTVQPGLGTQQTAFGGYGPTTIFDTILPGAVAGILNASANAICPTATNIWFGAAVGVASLVVLGASTIETGGTATVTEFGSAEAAEAAAQTGMQAFVKGIINAFTSKAGAVQAFSKTGTFGKKFAGTVVKATVLTVGATYLAKLMTVYDSGMFHSGLATGQMLTNDIDNGTNQLGNTLCRGSYYGRPLTYAETAQSDQADAGARYVNLGKQSTYQRYFALSNPDSMLTKFGEETVLQVNRRTVGNLISSLGNVFNPMSFIPKLFGSLAGKAGAAANVATENYGNVQCGYSQAELAIIQPTSPTADASYASPSENAFQLDNAGLDKYQAIDKEYGPCFTMTIGDQKSQKDADGKTYLVQTANGDISNDSVCSPQNLSINNPTYGDLVFRYRLEHFYDTTVQGLYNTQTAGESELGGTPTPTPTPAQLGA